MRTLTFVVALSLPVAAQDLLVTSRFTDEVLRYDATGAFTGAFASGGGLDNPVGLTFAPDGHLLVASANNDLILRYDGATGAFLGVFASGGGLSGARQLNFGPDGRLYVCSGGTSRVLVYDGTTGAPLGVFAQHPTLTAPTGMTFGPGGHLFVGGVLSNTVVRFHGVTGAFLGVFAAAGLNGPHDLSFGPDGHLYVSNAFGGTNDVVRFHGLTGVPLGTFVSDPALQFPLGLSWDESGRLLVANQGADEVRRYDGVTGQLLTTHVAAGAGGLDGPLFCAFTPAAGPPALVPPTTGTGIEIVLVQRGATPGGLVGTLVGIVPGVLPIGGCPGQTLGMLDPLLLEVGVADESGRRGFRQSVPPVVAGIPLRLQVVDGTACVAGPVLVHTP